MATFMDSTSLLQHISGFCASELGHSNPETLVCDANQTKPWITMQRQTNDNCIHLLGWNVSLIHSCNNWCWNTTDVKIF